MPSREEIWAAVDCMEQFMFAPHELPLDAELHEKYCQMAEQALIVAEHERWKKTVNEQDVGSGK
jgi:hypothetical protein